MRVFELPDQAQFLMQDLLVLVKSGPEISDARPARSDLPDAAVRSCPAAPARRDTGIELIERKNNPAGKPHGFRNRLRMSRNSRAISSQA